MTDVNIEFSRALLAQIIPDVRKAGKRPMRDADIWHDRGPRHRRNYEFHGPEGRVDWYGRADNAYEARYKGWSAWLAKQGRA
jgi:hypothetical protein